MAVLMSFVALSIDSILPAMNQIGTDLDLKGKNSIQLVISMVFFGMGVGFCIYGPVSDSFGRKPAIYLGMWIFLLGCLISIFSDSFEIMIIGRFLQGLGAASSRVVGIAMIRDRFEGEVMAKVMSLIMIVFILTPILAPSLGQLLLVFFPWQAIFVFKFILALGCFLWFTLRQEETLPLENRLDFSFMVILNGVKETLKNRAARTYLVASGLIYGAFVGYLSSAQQIIQIQYDSGELFPFYFGVLAISIGVSSFLNSRWVEKFGMEALCKKALVGIVSVTFIFLPYCFLHQGNPPFFIFIIYMNIIFLGIGIIFGNISALAMKPLGHIAGVANSVISSLQTLISVILGGLVGFCYDGTIMPLVVGFFIFGGVSLLFIRSLDSYEGSS